MPKKKPERFEARGLLKDDPLFKPCPECKILRENDVTLTILADLYCPVCVGRGYVGVETKKNDAINPSHYSAGMPEGIQVKDVLKAQGLWEATCRSNLIKYVLRAEYKNGLEDYKKAAQYLEWLIEEKESQNA